MALWILERCGVECGSGCRVVQCGAEWSGGDDMGQCGSVLSSVWQSGVAWSGV